MTGGRAVFDVVVVRHGKRGRERKARLADDQACVNSVPGEALQERETSPSVRSLVLAAFDDSWRELQGTLSQLIAREMEIPGVLGEWSVKDVVRQVIDRERALLQEIASGRAPSPGSQMQLALQRPDDGDLARPAREIMAEFEQTHRALKDALQAAPVEYFAYGSSIRRRIDYATVLSYQEHGARIRTWVNRRRREAANTDRIRLSRQAAPDE